MFSTMLWLIATFAIGTYVGVRTYRCLNPRYSHGTEYIFEDNEVKEFNLGVVSGVINVRTCPKIAKTTLFVVNKASRPDLLEVMPTAKHLADGVFSLNVMAPSFDFQNCQHTELTLVIPERLAKTQHLALRAQTVVGKISIDAPQYMFNSISVLANVGWIQANGVKALTSVEAEARVGLVAVHGIDAKAASLRTKVGKIWANDVKASEALVSVETGRAWLNHFETPMFTLSSEIAWVTIVEFINVNRLVGRVDYGKLTYVATRGWTGAFTVESPYGFIDVAHDKNVAEPKFTQKTPALMIGTFENTATKSTDKPAVVNLQATFASVNLYVPK